MPREEPRVVEREADGQSARERRQEAEVEVAAVEVVPVEQRRARGRGLGRLLVGALAEAAERAGDWKVLGLLFPTNAASVALFRAAGFKEVGVHRRHGLLDGRWRDVVVVELLLPLAEKDFTDSSAPA